MGICCFSCALKAAEIFHIRGLLYKKGWSGLGFAGRKTAVVTTAAIKSSPCFPHWWELLVCALPVTFQGSFLCVQIKSFSLFALGVFQAPAALHQCHWSQWSCVPILAVLLVSELGWAVSELREAGEQLCCGEGWLKQLWVFI